ncbi:MAG TPA: hypothetical protein VJR30_04765, partial [Bradyrhizobium sp.]|nr:hypothetical protein [Bradyrhizobium sp.]
YFQPSPGYSGTIADAVTFHAWDQTSGSNGTVTSIAGTGGSTAFSIATDTAGITINAPVTVPIVDLNNGTSGFDNVVHHDTDSRSTILIAEHATITDADSTNLQSMTITLTNPLDNSSGSGGVNIKETLFLTDAAAAIAAHDGLIVNVSAPNPIVLTITGPASVADYQAILAGVLYQNDKTGHQDTTDRTITVVVNDGTQDSAIHTTTVTNSNIITGTAGPDTLNSTSGNDYLTGGTGADNFSFGTVIGHDTIADFTPGTDSITFNHATFANVAAVLAATHDDGHGNTTITVNTGNSITLHDVTLAQLTTHQSDFHFV